MICFDSELFPQNFVWQLNNDRKSLKPHRNCQIKSSKWLYFSFHMSQRINNIQFYSYESIFPTNFKCSKHFALKKSSELWHSSSSRKGRLRIAAFQYYNSKDYGWEYVGWFAYSNGKAFIWVKIATCQICNPLNNIQSFFFSPSCTFKLVGFQKVCKYVNTSVRGKYF